MAISRKGTPNLQVIPGGAKNTLEEDLDALFRLPLTDFIGARKTLAAKLKKEGRSQDADRVTALAKPSISVWTVNQLYWHHRQEFAQLLATGQRFREAQTSKVAGNVDRMRQALDARRDALSQLSDLATTLLRKVGHNPTLDMVRRISTTLEAMSAYASLPEGMAPGRLTQDIDPPGFDSLAGFTSAAGPTKVSSPIVRERALDRARGSSPTVREGVVHRGKGSTPTVRKGVDEPTRIKEARQARLAAAKVSLQEAKKSLADARSRAQSVEAAQKKADAEAKQAERQKREAEARFKQAIAAATAAAVRAQNINIELQRAIKAVENAQRTVEKASSELESLFRDS